MTRKRIPLADLKLLRREAELQLNAVKKKHLDIPSSPDEMQRIIHELAVYQIELEMQQDELLQTRLELEESLDCYTELYDFAPLGYLTISREGVIRKVNLSGSKLLGIDRSHLIGDRLGRFVLDEDRPKFNALLDWVFSTRDHGSCEVILQNDGSTCVSDPLHCRTVRIDAVVSNDGHECRTVISDISMQKQVERENKALMARLIHARRKESTSSSDGTALSDFNHQLLDKVIHSRIRFAVLSFLNVVEQACFVEIKKQVRTTDGNLSVHMRMLESAEYISCDKDVQSRKPQTMYRIMPKGHDAFLRYKECLGAFLGS